MSYGVALGQVAEKSSVPVSESDGGGGEWAFEFETAGDPAKKIGAGVAAHFARRSFMPFGRIRNVTRSILFL
jgi:hypothetical protein